MSQRRHALYMSKFYLVAGHGGLLFVTGVVDTLALTALKELHDIVHTFALVQPIEGLTMSHWLIIAVVILEAYISLSLIVSAFLLKVLLVNSIDLFSLSLRIPELDTALHRNDKEGLTLLMKRVGLSEYEFKALRELFFPPPPPVASAPQTPIEATMTQLFGEEK